jgi:excisionase family DNA binding protein
VADWEGSDLTQREFAQERGLTVHALRYWVYRLRKESRPLVADASGAGKVDCLLTVADVARMLREPKATVYKPVAEGKLPHARIGNTIRLA